ncbi:Fructose-2,6-bisphosphatase domain-containing protein [Rozella allomycis CSF55]|uniref:Fructose-2,6-bisphosphatase domain-containing protein n=1 Tax=Rozella allomycis (strain CSF55) TaxID=988480 RepID=A0A075B2M5_ROZAC|nr:Fructose-2,6-bisphosphatase domain-containing protein [Rozella allomycis CSF55]|eukprot:EPZ36812.1 Fructose-2,6-bisphosphatase domain-containing protein [Rozella allomycis CSF55]
MAHKLTRYLRWLGIKTKLFNVGTYRRQWIGARVPNGYFDPSNKKNAEDRVRIANVALSDMIKWLMEGGQIGVYDAANTTKERRMDLLKILSERGIKPEIIEANIKDIKISSPDYTGVPAEEAVADFLKRIQLYESSYDTVQDGNLSFIKIFNVGEHIIINRIKGYLQSKMATFLANLHTSPRTIYLVRHGESYPNQYKQDPGLSETGTTFTQQLKLFFLDHRKKSDRPLAIWTSAKKRSLEMAAILQQSYPVCHKPQLAELNMGICTGLSEYDIQTKYPNEYVRHLKDPYHYRYPRGESYLDLAMRLEFVILELEKAKCDVVICAHDTVLKCLYAYFLDRPDNEIPFLTFPRHLVFEITPRAYGYTESRYFVHPVALESEPGYTPIYENEFKVYTDRE